MKGRLSVGRVTIRVWGEGSGCGPFEFNYTQVSLAKFLSDIEEFMTGSDKYVCRAYQRPQHDAVIN